MKNISLILIPFFIISCAQTKPNKVFSSVDDVRFSERGTLMTINLITNGLVKRGHRCNLIIDGPNGEHEVLLKEGDHDYGVQLPAGQYQFKKLNCGPFYFYHLEDPPQFNHQAQRIEILAPLRFELKNKGELAWGISSRSRDSLKQKATDYELNKDNLFIEFF